MVEVEALGAADGSGATWLGRGSARRGHDARGRARSVGVAAGARRGGQHQGEAWGGESRRHGEESRGDGGSAFIGVTPRVREVAAILGVRVEDGTHGADRGTHAEGRGQVRGVRLTIGAAAAASGSQERAWLRARGAAWASAWAAWLGAGPLGGLGQGPGGGGGCEQASWASRLHREGREGGGPALRVGPGQGQVGPAGREKNGEKERNSAQEKRKGFSIFD